MDKLRDDGYRVWAMHGEHEVVVFEYKHSEHPRAAAIVRGLLALAPATTFAWRDSVFCERCKQPIRPDEPILDHMACKRD